MVFFYGHGYGPLGLFFDAEADDASAKSLMPLDEPVGRPATRSSERAAVIVFRSCQANTLETAYQLRDAGEFMLASQSIVPIAGIWPWSTFLSALMPGATSGDVARAIAEQLARFLETPANRDPFADVPYSLIDLGAASAIAEPLKALADALDAARHDAGPRGGVRGGTRSGAHRLSRTTTPRPAIRRSSTCRRCASNLARLDRDPVAGPARALGDVVGAPAGDMAPLTEGPPPRDRSLLPAGDRRSTPTGRTCTRKARRRRTPSTTGSWP